MYRYLLISSIAISVVIVLGSYLLSNKLFEIARKSFEIARKSEVVSDEQNMKITTKLSGFKVLTNKKAIGKKFVGENSDGSQTPKKEILSSHEELSNVAQEKPSNDDTISTIQNDLDQREQDKANQSYQRNYLTLEETRIAIKLGEEIGDPYTSPERRRELIKRYNELTRPLRAGNNRTRITELHNVVLSE